MEEETDPRHCHTAEGVEVRHQAFLPPMVVVGLLPIVVWAEGILNEFYMLL